MLKQIGLLAIVFVVLASPTTAEVPLTMSFQGVIDSTGGAFPTGTYVMTFRIYDIDTLGSPLWEEIQPGVSVEDGYFDAVLGSMNPLDTLGFDTPYWLGIVVGGAAELTPRVELASSPYALGVADSAITASKIADGAAVRTLNSLQDHVSVVGGSNVTVSLAGQSIVISATDTSGSASPHNTLDQAYDEGGAGLGRTISADDGAVEVTVGVAGVSEAIVADIDNATNTKNAVHATTDGTGNGVYGLTGVAPGVAGQPVRAGVAGESEDHVGVSGFSVNAHGAYGLSGPAPGDALFPEIGGVVGESVDEHGVSGFSVTSNGVYGRSNKTGSFTPALNMLKAGVLGEGNGAGEPNTIGVVGINGGYGSGVVGVGGAEKGTGVLGISGALPGAGTDGTFGVRGFAREGFFMPTLVDVTSKSRVGVLGQARSHVAVWGESEFRQGVVGSAGISLGEGDLPTSIVAGVYGHGAGTTYGVHGYVMSPGDSVAGVIAEGSGGVMGTPLGAALEIRNGAIRVSGAKRPAGTMTFPLPDTEIYSCPRECPDCTHDHVIGWTATDTLFNDLIVPESIILLSVEAATLPIVTYTVQLVSILPGGRAIVRLGLLGTVIPGYCVVDSATPKVHYQIINPFPDGK